MLYIKIYDDCGTYEKKVFENEVKSQTGIMDEELEITLNKAGVLDSEIEEMSPETVENYYMYVIRVKLMKDILYITNMQRVGLHHQNTIGRI